MQITSHGSAVKEILHKTDLKTPKKKKNQTVSIKAVPIKAYLQKVLERKTKMPSKV